MIIATDAIVLRQIPYSESSIICRLFTKKEGKITIIAKGARRPKKYISGLLEPINYISILYYNKNNRDIQLLKDIASINNFKNIRKNLNSIIIAFAIVEILDKTILNNHPYPIIFRLTWRVLDKLNNVSENHWEIFAFYLYHLSLRLGFMPNLTICSKCESEMNRAGINTLSGDLVCINCLSSNEDSYFNLDIIIKLKLIHIDEVTTLALDKKEILNLVIFFETFLTFHIEGIKNMKSMKMVKKLLY